MLLGARGRCRGSGNPVGDMSRFVWGLPGEVSAFFGGKRGAARRGIIELIDCEGACFVMRL